MPVKVGNVLSSAFARRGRFAWPVAAAAAVALAVTLPWGFAPTGLPGDHAMHRLVAEEWVRSWRQGVWWPPYLDGVNGGLGSLWPAYYPPLYHAGCAAGLAAGLDYWRAAGLLMALAQAAGAALCYGWLRTHVPRRAALLGTFAYSLAPYTVFLVYHRGAFPEGVATAWLPGVLWGCDGLRRRWRWAPAAGGMACFALVALCNNPAVVVVGYAAGVYVAVGAALRRRAGPLLRGLAVPLGGLALTAFFWLPAWAGQDGLSIPDSELARNPDSWCFYRFGEVRPALYGGLLDGLISLLGLTWLALGVTGLCARGRRRGWVAGWAMAGVGVWLCTAWAGPAYRHLPLLRYLQLPWRCLGMVAPGVALAVAYGLARPTAPRWAPAVLAGALALVVTVQRSLAAPVPEGAAAATPHRLLADYVPESAPLPNGSAPQLPAVERLSGVVSCAVARWAPGRRRIATEAAGPFALLVRTYAEPRWRAYDQSQRPLKAGPCPADYWGRVAVECPAGTTGVELRLEPGRGARAGAAVSGAAAAALLLGWAGVARRGRRAAAGGKQLAGTALAFRGPLGEGSPCPSSCR